LAKRRALNPFAVFGAKVRNTHSLVDYLRHAMTFKMLARVTIVVAFFGGTVHCSGQTYTRIETIAGNGRAEKLVLEGAATEIGVANPFGIGEEADGSLVICSFDWDVLYRLDPSYKTLKVIAGSGKRGVEGTAGQSALQMSMNQPHELQIDNSGNIYVADTMNHRVFMVDATRGTWQPTAGTGKPDFSGDGGPAAQATINQAYSIALDGEQLFVVDLKNHRIRQIDLSTQVIKTICGTGAGQLPKDGGIASQQPLSDPRSVAVDKDNIWIVLRGGNSVWRIDRQDNRIYHVAGTGKKGFSGDGGDAKQATLNGPKGIAVDPGRALFIADTENHAIRQIDLSSGVISTLVGSLDGKKGFNGDGENLNQRLLNRPHGICMLRSGDIIIGDSENHRVRRVSR
jgi:DNA-binding beta-propeller fold protein YncE